MNKIFLIIQREYLSRVRKRSFILTTFLVPLFFIGMYAGVFFLTKKSFEDTFAHVYVIDQEGSIISQLVSNKNITYEQATGSLDKEKESLQKREKNSYLLIIPSDFYSSKDIEILSAGKPNISTQSEIKNQLAELIRNQAYERLGLNAESIREIDDKINISAKEISETGEAKESHTEIAMGISMALAVLIYLSLFLYGAQVMRGIIEEKVSRIVEVIISSVKPFQLMMGKILGIGLVGLTQFLLWITLTLVLTTAATTFLVDQQEITSQLAQNSQSLGDETIKASTSDINPTKFLESIEITKLLVCFFIFFLGGYFLYSALFAAVGSAVDSETEASQFTMPITMPLLLAYILSFGVLVNDPHGAVATWLSFIPLTSPIAMLVRIPFGVPTWQIVISVVLLIAGFLLTTWAASRIYRVGILMYGKKASLKELIKWFKYKN
ncbi:ABC transporter permease [Sphingobacterium sp. UT-1RO-CII-1]|uniref:ABC transporter permease n=1 Tax=Sphingobacterium sp. UT-1RO-CII-1 TaxID=2995225 RepID=UPI00227C0A6E|nr:ABC transporter permease [Sphingobacterium sp. UT-1RO-CII-1]MCY4781377.1 ABC transporter permease [Sphingobacterium sp. UT-1RO-CII-1]